MGAPCRPEALIAARQVRQRVAAASILFRVAAGMICRMLRLKASAAEISNLGRISSRRSPADPSRQERELESPICYRPSCVAVSALVPAVASLPQDRSELSQLHSSVPTNKRQPGRQAKA